MAIDTLKRAAMFIAFCIVQALVLNHIHLLGYATPLLYIYFVIMFPRSYPKWAILLWSFCLGLSIDMFTNTPGMAAAALTLTGLLQPYLLEPFVPRDSIETLPVSARALGVGRFLTLSTVLVAIHCFVFFALEAFTFFNWQTWLLCSCGSTLLTMVFIIALENLRGSKPQETETRI